MLDAQLLAVANIPVGDHITRGPFNVDTIWTTAFACSLVVGLGLYVRRRATAGVPGKVQVFWELVVGSVGDQVESSLGPKYRRVVPLGVAIFTVVLAADWVEVLPGLYHNSDYANSPSADVNLTYALGILVFVLTNVAGIRAKGVKRWFKDFFQPIHVIEHITRPLTLALRLFGNIFAGGIMIALLLAFPIKVSGSGVVFGVLSVILTVIWKLFDMGIGVIQAFIFALLTILYYQFSTETHGGEVGAQHGEAHSQMDMKPLAAGQAAEGQRGD
jgi:F-type H+-transporting ATPase subunit a